MFVPRTVSATHHLLVVPVAHVQNLWTLTPSLAPLLRRAHAVGLAALQARVPGLTAAACRFVFHVPPFNSVDHLHLHCFVPPFVSFARGAAYSPLFLWAATIEAVAGRLEEGAAASAAAAGVARRSQVDPPSRAAAGGDGAAVTPGAGAVTAAVLS